MTSSGLQEVDTVGQHGRAIAVEVERARLARELHDGLANDLWFTNLQAKRLEEAVRAKRIPEAVELAAEVRRSLESSYGELRELVNDLRLPSDRASFVEQLARLAYQLGKRCGAVVALDVEVPRERYPSEVVAAQAILLAREAFANVAKHAGASRVTVCVRAGERQLRLVIADDGRGFDPLHPPGEQHHGLRSMHERVLALGGKLVIRSAPGRGTSLQISLPRVAERQQSGSARSADVARVRWRQEVVPGAPAAR